MVFNNAVEDVVVICVELGERMIVSNEFESSGEIATVAFSRYCPDIHLDGLGKATRPSV
jgi:hypothetical protein